MEIRHRRGAKRFDRNGDGRVGRDGLPQSIVGGAFEVSYQYGALGPSKGSAVNFAKSIKSTPSGGITHVYQRPGHTFGPGDFSCGGQLLVIDATAGIFAPSFFPDSGASLVVALFGLLPFAFVPFWGCFDSVLPAAGISLAYCRFGEASAGGGS